VAVAPAKATIVSTGTPVAQAEIAAPAPPASRSPSAAALDHTLPGASAAPAHAGASTPPDTVAAAAPSPRTAPRAPAGNAANGASPAGAVGASKPLARPSSARTTPDAHTSPGCSPPWTVDAEGIRHPKLECW
jgi:serine/threonine-protein kinase